MPPCFSNISIYQSHKISFSLKRPLESRTRFQLFFPHAAEQNQEMADRP